MRLTPVAIRPVTALIGLAMCASLVACGGGSKDDPKDAASPSPSETSASPDAVPATVIASFQTADNSFVAAFAAGEAQVRPARAAMDLSKAQAGGRALRAAFATLDADLRTITFPADVQPVVNTLLTSIGEAVAAFDAQNVTTDYAAFKAGDARVGAAVIAARNNLAGLRTKLGLPSAPPTPPSLSPSAAPAYQTKQTPLARPYVQGSTITDVAAWRDDLLAVGKANADAAATYDASRSYSYGIVEAWVGAFPLLKETGVVGSGVAAEPSGVSGFTVTALNSKEPESAANPLVLPFAARDASGRCAAGVLYGAELPTKSKVLTLPAGAKCTGAEAKAAAEKAGLRG